MRFKTIMEGTLHINQRLELDHKRKVTQEDNNDNCVGVFYSKLILNHWMMKLSFSKN